MGYFLRVGDEIVYAIMKIMCIIMHKPAGIDMPPEDELRYLFRRNPDGAGFAIQGNLAGDGVFRVVYKKGFMTADSLMQALGSFSRLKDFTVVVHCRKKGFGKINTANCHPFPLCREYHTMKHKEGEGAVLFHNGNFRWLGGGLLNPDASDTENYVRGVAIYYLVNPQQIGLVEKKVLQKLTGTSRVLVLYPDTQFPILKLGKWHKYKGCFYSTMRYKKY